MLAVWNLLRYVQPAVKEVILTMTISKTSLIIAAFAVFSFASPAMALTEKAPPRNEDTSDTDGKYKARKPVPDTPPARKRERCATCRILM
jgi:hypothetical protein